VRRRTAATLVVRCVVAVTAALLSQGVLAAIASAHTCGDVWCSGSDGSTGNNTQGNNPQIYVGEVGLYNVDFGPDNGPCGGPGGTCWSNAGANGAANLKQSGNGIGVHFYYLAGGPTASAAAAQGSKYCWGWAQAKKAIADADNRYGNWVNGDQMMFIDIELNNTYGWGGTPTNNRDVFNGFRDYLQGQPSQDTGNCPNDNNGRTYQHAVYSGPSQWSYSFSPSFTDLSRTPEWTYDDCCNDTWPGDFNHSSSDQAHWFGGSGNNDWHDMWQFNQNPDHDILKEPLDLPFFGHSVGT
jgi:hypothetical protein